MQGTYLKNMCASMVRSFTDLQTGNIYFLIGQVQKVVISVEMLLFLLKYHMYMYFKCKSFIDTNICRVLRVIVV